MIEPRTFQQNKTPVFLSLYLIVVTLMMSQTKANAQYFNAGQEPSRLKWKKIETLHFEIIFPESDELQGKKVAQLMEKAYEHAGRSLNHAPKKVSVVLHTQTVKSNAFLGWAPSRMELYTTPPQDIYSQDWLEQLAIHEFRHMVQMSKLDAEMPKLLRYLFGEQAAAILTAVYMPFWFIEGDAVCTETALSYSGRGRLPEFFLGTQAHLVENKPYSFDKAYLGSYKDYVPNHYQMGYLTTAGARYLFNDTIWNDVMHRVAQKPFSLNAFEKGLKISTGLKKKELYDTVYRYFQNEWRKNDISQATVPVTYKVNPTGYANYKYGSKLTNGSYFAEKTSLNDISRFVTIDNNGNEKVLFTPGYAFDESISAKDSMVVWSEHLSHPRWQHADLSYLRIHNLNTGKTKGFRYRNKYFAPCLSPDNAMIAVSEADNFYRFHLRIIDSNTGNIIQSFSTPENDYFIQPVWSNTSKSILAILMRNNQKGIGIIDLKSSEIKMILPYDNQEIKSPVDDDEYIYFIGNYSGNNAIYSLKKSTGETSLVVTPRYGAANLHISNKELIYSDYTSNGYRLASIRIDSINHQIVHLRNLSNENQVAENLTKQEGGAIHFSDADNIDYTSLKYRKMAHAINIHSWAPLVIDPVNYTIAPGVSFMSQNKLSTTELIAGYRYDIANIEGIYFSNFKYLGWYPILQTNLEYGKKKSYYNEVTATRNGLGQVINLDTLKKDFSWKQADFSISADFPFDFSAGKFYRKIQPAIDYQFTSITASSAPASILNDGYYQSINLGLYGYQILHSSHQDLLPNFGFIFDINYTKSLRGMADFGSSYSIAAVVYLPGLISNHGVKVYNAYQRKYRSTYSFNDRIRIARGHQRAFNDEMYTIGTDYMLPLLYPDVSLGKLLYVKRLKTSIYYDQSFLAGSLSQNNQPIRYNYSLRSTGIEFTTDVHIMRFIAPVEIGFRTGYLFQQKFDFDFLFNIQFTI